MDLRNPQRAISFIFRGQLCDNNPQNPSKYLLVCIPSYLKLPSNILSEIKLHLRLKFCSLQRDLFVFEKRIALIETKFFNFMCYILKFLFAARARVCRCRGR